MLYFFDESGNWQEFEREKRRLVIAGMLIKKRELFYDLKNDMKLFMAENSLHEIHATDIKEWDLKLKLYELIYKYIKNDDIKVLSYVIDPKILLSKTKKDPDEIYSDIASQLIGDMIFGDKNEVVIEYDIKFHYAYTANVIENMNKERDYDEYAQMAKNFSLREDAYEKQKKRILGLFKKRNPFKNEKMIYDFIGNRQKVAKYLWEEFRLKSEESAITKEIFKEKINSFIKTTNTLFGLKEYEPKIKISFKGKHSQSAGVQFIDLINNIIWHNGLKPNPKAPEIVKNIYSYIEIKDIR